jgi:hypothetical protein
MPSAPTNGINSGSAISTTDDNLLTRVRSVKPDGLPGACPRIAIGSKM